MHTETTKYQSERKQTQHYALMEHGIMDFLEKVGELVGDAVPLHRHLLPCIPAHSHGLPLLHVTWSQLDADWHTLQIHRINALNVK